MDSITDRSILVPASALDDLLELVRAATNRLPQDDPLTHALRGAAGAVRAESILEP